MKFSSLDLLSCPACRGALRLQVEQGNGHVTAGGLRCAGCGRVYGIADGIPRFVEPQALTGPNRRFSQLYDWFSPFYDLYARLAFAFIGGEARCRREVLDRLQPHGRLLEVSIGPGSNLPYLTATPGVGDIYGLDISPGQLRQCRRRVARHGWPVELFLGNAEQLPFRDGLFDAVLHIGGLNFFNDRRRAMAEMLRVARPGAKVVIVDEKDQAARIYDLTLPGFRRALDQPRPKLAAPVELAPAAAQDLRVSDVWNGWFWCLEFRKA